MKAARIVLAVLIGYLLWALGLSFLVLVWFVDAATPPSPISLVLLVALLPLLGLATGYATRLVAGPGAPVALPVVAAAVVVVTIVNIVLGVAVEPLWFKLAVLLLVPPGVLFFRRHRGAPAP